MDILLVDDSKMMRQLVRRSLRQAGYDALAVGEAGNGVEALAMIQEQQPRLVLSDWNMPEMLGIDLLRNVRQTPFKGAFGFITSESSDEIRESAEREGAAFLLTKPFTPDAIKDAIAPVLAAES